MVSFIHIEIKDAKEAEKKNEGNEDNKLDADSLSKVRKHINEVDEDTVRCLSNVKIINLTSVP